MKDSGFNLPAPSKPYWIRIGYDIISPYTPGWCEGQDELFKSITEPTKSFPCLDCGQTLVEYELTRSEDGGYGETGNPKKQLLRVIYCRVCLDYHKQRRDNLNTLRFNQDIEAINVLNGCKDWTVKRHIDTITIILRDYAKIKDVYHRAIDEYEKLIMAKYENPIPVEAILECHRARNTINPEVDIELQYFIPGITETVAIAIYNAFSGENNWHVSIVDNDEEFCAVTFKIRSVFKYDDISLKGLIIFGNSNDLIKAKEVDVEHKYLDEEFGKPGEYIRLIRTIKK